MDIVGSGNTMQEQTFYQCCETLGLSEDPCVLWAVLHVETKGFGFNRDKTLPMLFERHVFHRLTGGKFSKQSPDISSKTPGGYLAPHTREYGRFMKAEQLDRESALKSASWGLGQIMGFNYPLAGFESAADMVSKFMAEEDHQLFGVTNFLLNTTGLRDAMISRDWPRVARAYNGRNYEANAYHIKLQKAYKMLVKNIPDFGVRDLQAKLWLAGYSPGPIDGILGARTERAELEYNKGNK